MSKSLNVCVFSGYLAADPKFHTFDDGNRVANLRLAVNDTKKEDGQYVDDPLFIDVKAYGARATTRAQYLHKGSCVIVNGSLAQPRQWTADDGTTRFTQVIDRAEVTFGPKVEQGVSQAPYGGGGQRQATPVDDDDSSIPF